MTEADADNGSMNALQLGFNDSHGQERVRLVDILEPSAIPLVSSPDRITLGTYGIYYRRRVSDSKRDREL